MTIIGAAFAFVQYVGIALLGDVVLLVVQADARQIVDLTVLVVGLAVDALALGQSNVIILLLKGKPDEQLGKLQIVRLLLCLLQQSHAQIVGDTMVHVIVHHGLQAVADGVVLSRMGLQLKEIVPECLLIVGRRLIDVSLVQIEGFLPLEECIAFLQNSQSHIVHSPRLKSKAQVSEGRGMGRQVFYQLVELLFGLVRLTLHVISIDEIGHGFRVTRIFLCVRLKLSFSLVVILQMEQAFDILLEKTGLIGLLEKPLIQVASLFIILLTIVLRSQLIVDLDLFLLLGIHFLPFWGCGNLGIHRNEECKMKKQKEKPVSFHRIQWVILFPLYRPILCGSCPNGL